MKNAYRYIIDSITYENMLDDIDIEMVSESLKCSILKQIDKQIHEINGNKENSWYSRKYKLQDLLSSNVAIDKITDDDVVEYTDPKERKKAIRSIIIDSTSQVSGTAVLANNNGKVVALVNNYNKISFQYGHIAINNKFNKNDVIEQFTDPAYKLYVIYYDSVSNIEIKNSRWKAKQGIVLQGDENYYRELARANIERYRRIISKNKVEKEVKSDTTAKDLQKLLNDVMDLQVKIFNEPEKYTDVQKELEKAQGVIGGDRWQSNKGATVMILFATYTDYMKNILKSGGASYERSGYEQSKNKLKERMSVAQNYYEKAKEIFDNK